MTKCVYAGSLLIALTLILSSVLIPHSFLMNFVSNSDLINVARGVLALLMLGLIFSNPPRSTAFRAVLGAMSLGFAVWSVHYVFSGTIQLADAVLFLHAAFSFAIAALEPSSIDHTVEARNYSSGRTKTHASSALA